MVHTRSSTGGTPPHIMQECSVNLCMHICYVGGVGVPLTSCINQRLSPIPRARVCFLFITFTLNIQYTPVTIHNPNTASVVHLSIVEQT